jgi:cobalt-zinc-cadmium efflux system outer membrane protein
MRVAGRIRAGLAAAALAACLFAPGCVSPPPAPDAALAPPARLAPPVSRAQNDPTPPKTEAHAADLLPPKTLPPAADVPPDGPLDLAHFVRLAAVNNPEVAAARTRVEAARGRMVQAGLYPNPVIELRQDEAGLPGGALGFVGVTFIQNFVRGGKLKLDRAAAGEAVTALDWQAVVRWFAVLTQVRAAYVEKLAADREVAVSKDVVAFTEKGSEAAKMLRQKGAGTEPDVLQAQVEHDQAKLRLEVAKQRADAAARVLAAVVGVPGSADGLKLHDLLDEAPPEIDFDSFRDALLQTSCEVREAEALARQADFLVRRAEAETTPDLLLQTRPQYSSFDKRFCYTLIASAPVPVWNRNQGGITAARAEHAARMQDVRRVQNRLAERLALAHQRFTAARKQAEAFRKDILPRAEESLRLVRLGYEKGDPKYDYVTVLNAQRTLAQVKLAQVQALAEQWRALSELAGLAQWEAW